MQSRAGNTVNDRLARLARWCVTGQLAAAELELHAWQRQSDCPPAARTLLASLLARRGQIEHAIDVASLKGRNAALPVANDAHLADPRLAQMLIALYVDAGLTDQAQAQVQRLLRLHGDNGEVLAWLESMRLADADALAGGAQTAAARLAGELAGRLELVPTLVAAQRVSAKAEQLALLRRAIAYLYPSIDERRQQVSLCQASAELALLAGDDDAARRWAQRGLAIEPYSAALALLLSQASPQASASATTAEVLRQAAEAHPNYPDVQAALIRRLKAQGDADEARRRLKQWLGRDPDQTLARQVDKELAA